MAVQVMPVGFGDTDCQWQEPSSYGIVTAR